MAGRYKGVCETQRKINAILAQKNPEKKPKPIVVPFHVAADKIVSALEKFDRKIDVAMYLSKN